MRISDWSSDVCSSDLQHHRHHALYAHPGPDAAALAGLRLVDAGDLGAQPDLGAGHWRGDGYGPARPARSHELLLRPRAAAAVAGPFLALRPSGGLYHYAARLVPNHRRGRGAALAWTEIGPK